jgi:hypothetical protein
MGSTIISTSKRQKLTPYGRSYKTRLEKVTSNSIDPLEQKINLITKDIKPEKCLRTRYPEKMLLSYVIISLVTDTKKATYFGRTVCQSIFCIVRVTFSSNYVAFFPLYCSFTTDSTTISLTYTGHYSAVMQYSINCCLRHNQIWPKLQCDLLIK